MSLTLSLAFLCLRQVFGGIKNKIYFNTANTAHACGRRQGGGEMWSCSYATRVCYFEGHRTPNVNYFHVPTPQNQPYLSQLLLYVPRKRPQRMRNWRTIATAKFPARDTLLKRWHKKRGSENQKQVNNIFTCSTDPFASYCRRTTTRKHAHNRRHRTQPARVIGQPCRTVLLRQRPHQACGLDPAAGVASLRPTIDD